MTRITYHEARHIIQDGDIIFVHGSWQNLTQAVIMFFTASEFSHACIAYWVNTQHGKLLVCVEAQGHTKRRIFPLSLYCDSLLTVITAPKPWNDVKIHALSKVGKADYGMIEAIYIGLREFVHRHTGYKLPVRTIPNEFCSTFVATVYGLQSIDVSPQTLYERLTDQPSI